MIPVSSGPPGVLAGKPREIVKVTPVIRNSMPSVVMNDGTLSPIVISPITRPISAQAASAARIAAAPAGRHRARFP